MELLEVKKATAIKCISGLKYILDKLSKKELPEEVLEALKDGLNMRFRYSFDTFWKYLKEYLRENFNDFENQSAKETFESCASKKIITKEELESLLNASSDRITVPELQCEDMTEQVCERIKNYHEIMQKIVDQL